MPEQRNPNAVGRHTGLSLVLFVVALIAYVGSYWYVAYAREKAQEALVPKLALQSFMGDLRRCHQKIGRFPADVVELRDVLGRKEVGPRLDDSGLSFVAANYFYGYARVTEHAATVWAVPLGPQRDQASTNFLVVTASDYSLWKGPALSEAECRQLRANPTAAELAAVGLTKQEARADAVEGQKQKGGTSGPGGKH